MPQKYKAPEAVIAVPPIRGVREASIDVGIGQTTMGVHRTEFVSHYDFLFWTAKDTGLAPPQYSSLIHGNIPSKGVALENGGGRAAYFNAIANGGSLSENDETFQTVHSPPDVSAQAIQNPAWGCRRMSCALNVQATAPAGDVYTLSLFRGCNILDAIAYLGGAGNDLLIEEIGPFAASVAGTPTCALVMKGFEIPVGSSFYFRLRNITNPLSTNALMGSLFLHA